MYNRLRNGVGDELTGGPRPSVRPVPINMPIITPSITRDQTAYPMLPDSNNQFMYTLLPHPSQVINPLTIDIPHPSTAAYGVKPHIQHDCRCHSPPVYCKCDTFTFRAPQKCLRTPGLFTCNRKHSHTPSRVHNHTSACAVRCLADQ